MSKEKEKETIEEHQVVIVGESGVGKSAVTMQYLKGFFLEDYDPTIDDKYQKQTVVDNKKCILEIIDTAGQEAYTSIRDHYLRTGEGFIIAYSVTDRASFEKVQSIYRHILRVKETTFIPCVLIGNKSDLNPPDRISLEEGKELASLLKIPFFETSAKRSENIEECYAQLLREIRKYESKKVEKKDDKKRSTRKIVKNGLRSLLSGFKISGKT